MKEKILLSTVAALLGLLVAGGAFYIYQMTQVVDDPKEKEVKGANKQTTPTPENSEFLIIESPKDEEVFNKRLITINGRTTPGTVVIVSTESSDQVVEPTEDGSFTLTHTIDEGANVIQFTGIFPNGQEETVQKTVTFTTEEF